MAVEPNVSRVYPSDHLKKQMEQHYLEYVLKQDLNIFCGTWNAAGKEPSDALESWLLRDDNFDADIYAIGFQEVVDLNAKNIIIENNQADLLWQEHINKVLKPNKYRLLRSHQLVGILLLIYVKKELYPECTNILIDQVGVGLFHLGNKGGVGIRFNIYDSQLIFICSHLAAHKNHIQERNQDYAKIITSLKFGESRVEDHDMIFWLGDLNYRLLCEDLEEVYEHIQEKDIPWLLRNDQLNNEMQAKHVFQGFKEGPISFLPTYKYQPGTCVYERREDKKKRMPAWCDRILWRTGETGMCEDSDIELLEYNDSQEQCMSDHKPVYGLYQFQANKIDPIRYDELKRRITRKLDMKQNELKMKIEVGSSVNFGEIKFGQEITRSFEVKNVGQVVAEFGFGKREDGRQCKKWLQINPLRGYVKVDEKKTVFLTVHVTRECVQEIAELGNELNDIIIVSYQGAGCFVELTGKYIPSSYGQSIQTLVKLRQPIYEVNLNDLPEPEKVLSVPKEVWRMVDYIYKRGLDTPDLFRQRGEMVEIIHIRECLDSGREFNSDGQDISIHSMAQALTILLESFSEPVFPMEMCEGFENYDLSAFCKEKLMNLPIPHYNTFIYIISFLREVCKHSNKNNCEPRKIAFYLAQPLMRAPVWTIHNLEIYGPFRVLHHFLTDGELGHQN